MENNCWKRCIQTAPNSVTCQTPAWGRAIPSRRNSASVIACQRLLRDRLVQAGLCLLPLFRRQPPLRLGQAGFRLLCRGPGLGDLLRTWAGDCLAIGRLRLAHPRPCLGDLFGQRTVAQTRQRRLLLGYGRLLLPNILHARPFAGLQKLLPRLLCRLLLGPRLLLGRQGLELDQPQKSADLWGFRRRI